LVVPIDDWTEPGDQALAIVQVMTTVETDPNYGADADGRRGMSCTWVEHDALAVLSIEGPDGCPVDLATVSVERLAAIRAQAEQQADEDEYGDDRD
jgi:hypothetical protein